MSTTSQNVLCDPDLRTRARRLHAYACRGQYGSMHPLPPGQSRSQAFCPNCQFQYGKRGCLFDHETPAEMREQAAAKNSVSQHQQANRVRSEHVCAWNGCTQFISSDALYCSKHAQVMRRSNERHLTEG